MGILVPNANMQCEKSDWIGSNAREAERPGPVGVLNMSTLKCMPAWLPPLLRLVKSVIFLESKWPFQSSKWQITGVKYTFLWTIHGKIYSCLEPECLLRLITFSEAEFHAVDAGPASKPTPDPSVVWAGLARFSLGKKNLFFWPSLTIIEV